MSVKLQAHYERFQHNAELAQRMEVSLPGDLDWCCVVMFYACLHLLDAYLSTKRFPFAVDSHPHRNLAIRQSPELRRFGTSYRELQDISEQIRYDPAFRYKAEHHAVAKRNLTKLVSVLEPRVKRLMATP